MKLLQILRTSRGLTTIMAGILIVWMMLTLRHYLMLDFQVMYILKSVDGGWLIMVGVLVLQYAWMVSVLTIKQKYAQSTLVYLAKRLLLHSLTYMILGLIVYFWWNQIVVEILTSIIPQLYINEMSLIQGIKIGSFCAVIFLPSVLTSVFGKNNRIACISIWLGMCILIAIPVKAYWWLWVYPIQPLSDRSLIPYGGSFHEAVKLIAGGNILRFILILCGTKFAR